MEFHSKIGSLGAGNNFLLFTSVFNQLCSKITLIEKAETRFNLGFCPRTKLTTYCVGLIRHCNITVIHTLNIFESAKLPKVKVYVW